MSPKLVEIVAEGEKYRYNRWYLGKITHTGLASDPLDEDEVEMLRTIDERDE